MHYATTQYIHVFVMSRHRVFVDPQKFKPNVAMPAHPTFDSATLDALQAYFKTVLPGG